MTTRIHLIPITASSDCAGAIRVLTQVLRGSTVIDLGPDSAAATVSTKNTKI